eukprot:scaffold3852_cov402-Prasinococcus_capsulatus_cf.AAC.10
MFATYSARHPAVTVIQLRSTILDLCPDEPLALLMDYESCTELWSALRTIFAWARPAPAAHSLFFASGSFLPT